MASSFSLVASLLVSRGILFHNALQAGSQPSQPLDFAGNDDLGGFAIGGRLEGFQTLELDHLFVGCSFVEQLQGVCLCLLHLQDRLRLSFCFQELCFLSSFGTEH